MHTGPYEDREPQVTTNTRILNAAARLFYRKGIRAVSVDEVAAAASVTKVTVYKHYRKTRCRRYFRALAEAADMEDPDAISDQWMLLTEGATITALVEGDRAAAHKARAGADAILRTLQAAA